ncbi:LuxR C-terminal-related transcriptional regulator [Mumia sp. DW29H23]|uniref:LuxR C-terminal-related transcriptional regulator n=1 Tax=Mumia sp. DW29H23 TaxID=3421241 RepID=UPI003D68310B
MHVPVRLFMVSPAAAIRESLARELDAYDEITVVGEAGSSSGGVSRAAAVRPDVVLAGAHMRDPDSIEMTRLLRAAVPDVQVLLLGLYPSPEFVSAALNAGVAGVLIHTVDVRELVRAIQTAATGQMVLTTRTLMSVLSLEHAASPPDPLASLTPLERELFALVGEGLSNREIAQRLHLSPGTVRNYVSRLLRKLEIDGRGQVIALAARRELTGHTAV